jgi:hypothetical protein
MFPSSGLWVELAFRSIDAAVDGGESLCQSGGHIGPAAGMVGRYSTLGHMTDSTRPLARCKPIAILAVSLCTSWPLQAGAQTAQPAEGTWRFSGSIYAYLPRLGGSSSVPADSAGTSINVSTDQILDKLQFMMMGALEAHNGRWGAFTDLLYLNFGDTKEQSRDFTIGNIGIPADTTAKIDSDLKGVVWTQVGQYRFVSDPAITLDAIGGLRLFEMRQTIRWNITGSIGPLDPAARIGESKSKLSLWDAIAGVKGRYSIDEKWSLPFYADIGTGESDLTWQVAGGVTYKFSWGELSALLRYLAYEMKPGKSINDLNFNGPMIGATFRW